MGTSQNYEPVLVIDYSPAPNISGVPKWDPNSGDCTINTKLLTAIACLVVLLIRVSRLKLLSPWDSLYVFGNV